MVGFDIDLEGALLDCLRLVGPSDSVPESDEAVVDSSSDCSLFFDFFDLDWNRFFRFSVRSSSSSS